MKFNINDRVRIKLTDKGRKILQESHSAAWVSLKEDADGWSELKLWHAMSYFGKHIFCGSDLCFETEIEIPEPSK